MTNGKILKIELDDEGIQQMLKGSDMRNALREVADQLPLDSGYDYEMTDYIGRTRANVQVACADARTYRHELKTNSLIKALKGGNAK